MIFKIVSNVPKMFPKFSQYFPICSKNIPNISQTCPKFTREMQFNKALNPYKVLHLWHTAHTVPRKAFSPRCSVPYLGTEKVGLKKVGGILAPEVLEHISAGYGGFPGNPPKGT